MTPERAKEITAEIWNNNPLGQHSVRQSITPEEEKEIIRTWKTIPGNTCFYDAVLAISKR